MSHEGCSDDALAPWLDASLSVLRTYLTSRGVDYTPLCLREKREFSLLAKATADRLGETPLHMGIEFSRHVNFGAIDGTALRAMLERTDALTRAVDESLCGACGVSGALRLCGGCRIVRYCDPKCQKRHWRSHKLECAPSAPVPLASFDASTLAKRRPGVPLVLRGDRLLSATWDTLDQDAIALPAGTAIDLSTGGRTVRVTGPLTAGIVLDTILKMERNEPLGTTYPPGSSDATIGCAKCPRQGFCGMREAGTVSPAALAAARDGVKCWEALWSEQFCHTGISMDLLQVYHSKSFFAPAQGSTTAAERILRVPVSLASLGGGGKRGGKGK